MKISKRGQITVPKHLRESFGMNPGTEVEIFPTEEGLMVRKVSSAIHPVDRVAGILDEDEFGKDVSVDDYIEEIRGR